ncbi:MAG TPA: outer membrane protein assembly factor BamD [Opitutaceae bacterium]|nr:outer membrane protein assembly factor BamD [Opitutaceae bacterium]
MRYSRLPALAFSVAVLALLAGRSAADLVWSPQTGWRVEGGVLEDFTTEDGRNALDLMNKARTAEEKGESGDAIDLYEKVAKRYPSSVFAPEAFYRIGNLHYARKSYFKAFEAYQQVVSRYPNTPNFNEVIGRQYRIAAELGDGARNHIFGIIPGFKNRDRAVQYFEQTIANAPFSDYAPLSLMNVAKAHQRLGNTEEAIDALDRMINFYPRSVLAPDAYLKLAQTHSTLVDGPYYDQASTNEAITYFEDFMILFPGDPGVGTAEKGLSEMKTVLAESKMILADYYYKHRRNYRAARVLYNEAITVYPDSEIATRARERLADVDARLAQMTPPPAPAAAGEKQPSDAPSRIDEKKRKRFFFF